MSEENRLVYTDGHGNALWPRSFSAEEDKRFRTLAQGGDAQRLLDAQADVLYEEHARQLGLREVVTEEEPQDDEEALHRAHLALLGVEP